MCALINADSEAKTKVQEELSEDEQSGTEEIDYYSKKIDKKDYVKWVEDKAMESLKTIAAYKLLCKENKLEISKEDESFEDLLADLESSRKTIEKEQEEIKQYKEEIKELIEHKSEHMDLVFTGRCLPEEVRSMADEVTKVESC